MPDETLADLLNSVGLRPAWERTREARPGYQQQQSPAGALADPRTLPYRRIPTRRDREFSRASLADTAQRGAWSEPRNQIAEAGMNVLETTGAPSFARGVRSIQANEPGRAAGEFAMGGLGLLGTASLPFGSGARPAPPRIPRIQQAIPEAQGIPNAPPRLPGRATDGSVLPMRPREPIRQSLVGGSDDLREAVRSGPDAGPVQNLDAGAMTALRRELRDHDFEVPSAMPDLPQIEVPLSSLRAGRIGSLDTADARRYAAMNTEAPPILVRRQGNGWHIIDGNRRTAAAQLRGDETVRAIDATDLFSTAPDGGSARTGFRLPTDIRRPSEDINEVLDANFEYGQIVGNETAPIDSLIGGVSSAENGRVGALARQISGPDGYVERIIVDDVGNVIEGQHRLDALRQLGATEVPIVRVRDNMRNFDFAEVSDAMQSAGQMHSDQVHGLVRELSSALARENGSVAAVRANWEPPRGFAAQWEAGLNAVERRAPNPSRTGPNAGPPRPPPMFPGGRNR